MKLPQRRTRGSHLAPAVAVLMAAGLMLSGCFATGADGPTSDQGSDSTPALPEVAPPLALENLAAFSAVGAVNAGSNCTGTLIDTGVPSAPAYVLTNGHCVGDVGRAAQVTTLELPWWGEVEFLRAAGNEEGTLVVEVDQLSYSTMRETDTAVIRLDSTLGALQDLGVQALPIADIEPDEGTAVTNVGVPVQDLLPEDWVLRQGTCTLGQQTGVLELRWLWQNVWTNDCPGIIQGSSGSPLMTVDGDGSPTAIVAMINTTTWGVSSSDGGACFINRPCQLTDDGPVMVEETSYAQSVAGIGACFDEGGLFALTESCPLPTSNVWAESGGGAFMGGTEPNSTGAVPGVSLVGDASGTARTALVPLVDGSECTDPATYAGASEVMIPEAGDEWEVVGTQQPVELPQAEGWYAYCAVVGNSYAQAATILFEVDRTAPIFEATADVEDLGEGAVLVRPHLNPPELSTVRFTWGSPDEVDCEDTASFQDFFIVPLTLMPEDLPARYCVYGLDAAGNTTGVAEIDIPTP